MGAGRQVDAPLVGAWRFSVQSSVLGAGLAVIVLWLCVTRPALSTLQAESSSQAASIETQAETEYKAGRLQEAERLLGQAVQLDPRSARAHALLGLTLARRADLMGALRNLEQAHEIEPANPDYAYNYAVLLLQARRFSAAATILESLRAASPESADLRVNLARAYAGSGDFARLDALVSSLPATAYDDEAQIQALATVLAEAKQMPQIERLWRAAIGHDSRQDLPYAALAEFWTARGESGRALALLDSAPSTARTALYDYARGETLLALRKYNDACSVLQEATRLAPRNDRAWQQLVRAYMLADRLSEAQAAAETASKTFPDAAEFRYQQAVIDYMLNRSAPAMELLTGYLSGQAAEDPRAVLLLAVLQSQRGEYEDAARNFTRLAELESGCNALAYYFYGMTLLRMHRPENAALQLQSAARCRPHFALAEYGLGQALSEEGKLPEALTAFEQAIDDQPTLAEPYYAIAQLRRRLGDEAGARSALAHFNNAREHVQDLDRNLFR